MWAKLLVVLLVAAVGTGAGLYFATPSQTPHCSASLPLSEGSCCVKHLPTCCSGDPSDGETVLSSEVSGESLAACFGGMSLVSTQVASANIGTQDALAACTGALTVAAKVNK